jgi:hypothetical protein
VDSEDLQPATGEQRQGEVIERLDEKIEVEIRELIRVRPQDFKALKESFEEWANQWN